MVDNVVRAFLLLWIRIWEAFKMTKESLIKLLHKKAERQESWTRLAESLGITPQYLQDIKDGRREPGDKLLRGLGMIKVITYVKEIK
jgi:hypothetical protein